MWHSFLRKIIGLNLLLPAYWIAWISEEVLGARLCAYFSSLVAPNRAADIAGHLGSPFLADVCQRLDQVHVGEIMRLMPVIHVRRVAVELFRRRDYPTIARLSEAVSPEVLGLVLEDVHDGEAFLRIALLIARHDRFADLLSSMKPRHIKAMVRAAASSDSGLWPYGLELLNAIPWAWQAQFINAAADGDEQALLDIINSVIRFDSWKVALPFFAKMNAGNQRRFVNAISHQDDDVLRVVLKTTEQHDLWQYLLPFLQLMDTKALRSWARVTDELNVESLRRILTVIHDNDLWSISLPFAQHMSIVRRGIVAEMIGTSADAELNGLIDAVNREGNWHILIPFLDLMSDAARCRVANWPLLLTETSLRNIFQAAQNHGLWEVLLPQIRLVRPANMVTVTRVAEAMDDGYILSRLMETTSPFSRRTS